MRMPGPGGKIMHAELKIGDSKIFVSDPMDTTVPTAPEAGASNPIYLFVYVPDVDNIFNRAVTGGVRVNMPVENMFWGDRYGRFADPFGQQWGIATHAEDVSPEEMTRRRQAFLARAAGQN